MAISISMSPTVGHSCPSSAKTTMTRTWALLVGKRRAHPRCALQELSRLAVQTQTGQRSWLMLDIDGFRNSRREELIKKAKRAIDEVKEGAAEFAFNPMNSFERKIIHDQAARAGLVSESEGEGDGRHVVIRPADD
jgi:spoIIIJ-associated protein